MNLTEICYADTILVKSHIQNTGRAWGIKQLFMEIFSCLPDEGQRPKIQTRVKNYHSGYSWKIASSLQHDSGLI